MCRMLPPSLALIVRALACEPGIPRTAEDLAGEVYSGVPDGRQPRKGPEAIRSAIAKARHRMAPFGWEIASQRGGRGGYALRKAGVGL